MSRLAIERRKRRFPLLEWDRVLPAVLFLLAVMLLVVDYWETADVQAQPNSTQRFETTALALPNFLNHFDERSNSQIVELASIKRDPQRAWGGRDRAWDSNFSEKSSRSPRKYSRKTTLTGDVRSLVSHVQSMYRDENVAPITSGFGFRRLGGYYAHHDGIDIALPHGSPIRAAWRGIVAFSGWQDGYGNMVLINHGDGKETVYAHASQLLVTPGEVVEAGNVIARVGNTGRSFGPHLHFELRVNSRAVNPERAFLKTKVAQEKSVSPGA